MPGLLRLASGYRRYIALGLIVAGLVLSLFGGDLSLLLSFFLFIAGLAIMFQSGCIMRWGLAFIGSLLLLLPGGLLQNHKTKLAEQKRLEQAEVAKRIAAEKATQEETARLEALRKKMPETYEKAVALDRAGSHSEAVTLFEQLTKLEPNYKDVSIRLQIARDKVAAAKLSKLLSDAPKLNCNDISIAESRFRQIISMSPDKAREVQSLRERMLACYQGEGQLQMAIQISKRRPLTLYVWIKNTSNNARHANPNYFTLVTKSGESLSYSSNSFEYSKPFPAVDLQPGTETSGIVVFDTSDAPRALIYQELLGARVSRDFP